MTEKDKKALILVELMLGDPKVQIIAQWKAAQQAMVDMRRQVGKTMFEGDPELVTELDEDLDSAMASDEQWDTFWDDLNIGEMMDLFTTVYADTYTEEEIDALIEMCKTPTYQLMRANNAGVTAKCQEISNRWMLNHSDEIMKAMENMVGDSPFAAGEEDE